MLKPILRVVVISAGLALLFLAGRGVPDALARVEIFRVDDVRLEGARYLTLDQAIRQAAIEPGASVWDDPAVWEARLARHPLVRSVEIRRRFPATLVLVVEEEEPVALVPTPTLEPVDRDGELLPIDPTRHRLDLPVARPLTGGDEAAGPPGAARVRPVARLADAVRLEPDFYRQVSEIRAVRDQTWRVRWGGEPEVVFQLPETVETRRLRDGMRVLADALARDAERVPREIDLRWADQIVVRY